MLNEQTTTVQDEKIDVVMQGPALPLTSLLDTVDETDPVRNKTVTYHLYQSDTMARAGVWDASTSEACAALDALIDAIVRYVFDTSKKVKRPLATSFKDRRRALELAGVLDLDDKELLGSAFMIARRKIKNCGEVDLTWITTARRLVHIAATHLLARYTAWRERTEANRV